MWLISHDFPELFKLYQSWCAAPAAATSVERLWSNATFLDDRLRARMDPDFLALRLFIMKNRPLVSVLLAMFPGEQVTSV